MWNIQCEVNNKDIIVVIVHKRRSGVFIVNFEHVIVGKTGNWE